MPGLLKQLQKNKKREAPGPSPVILPSTEVESIELSSNDVIFGGGDDIQVLDLTPPLETAIVPDGTEAATTPATLEMDGAAEAHPAAEGVSPRVVKRRRPSERTERSSVEAEALPNWRDEERRLPPVAEQLLPLACRKFCALAREVLGQQTDLEILPKRSVEAALKELPADVRPTWKDQDIVEKELASLFFEKGLFQQLFDDPAVTHIFFDGFKSVKAIYRGQTLDTPFGFRTSAEYELFVSGLLHSTGLELSPAAPMIDCVLQDRWRCRVNALHASIVEGDEPRVCIRIPRQQKVSFYDLLQAKVLPATLAAWLAELVAQGEANILVAGPAGSGKTRFMAALIGEAGSDERIAVVEDVPELFVGAGSFERLTARPGGPKGEGEVTMSALIKAAMRRKARRIMLGDVRDDDARGFLRALESGHSGSIGCLTADSITDALWEFVDLVLRSERAPQESILRRVSRVVQIVVALRLVDDKPCVAEVSEVLSSDGADFRIVPIVRFEGVEAGKRVWRLISEPSLWVSKLADRGVALKTGPGLLPRETPKKPV